MKLIPIQEVRKLGFNSLEEFFESKLWKDIQKEVLQRDNYVCAFCQQNTELVKTTNWSATNLAGSTPQWLVSICCNCWSKLSGKSAAERTYSLFAKMFLFDATGLPNTPQKIAELFANRVANNFQLRKNLERKNAGWIQLAKKT
jgi:hypothetical protein